MRCADVIRKLEELSPLAYAESWDNPGLLAGRTDKEIKRIYIAVDATTEAIAEAESVGADMLLTHHPLIFKGIKKVNSEDFIGRRILTLLQADMCYYAMHTNFDVMGMADAAADELKLLQGEAEKIRDIGNKLAALEEKYPEIVQKSLDSDMNMPTDKDMDTMPDSGSKDNKTDSGSTGSTPDNGSTGNKTDSGSTGSKTDDSSLPKFPAFEGKDLDGNTVKSSDLFSGKAVTVVNFWFTTCGPCVGELGDLDALNKELSGKGGALIGINAFTLDGNEAAISDAKDVLTQSGATYQNVYFDSGSEAGKFVESIYAYPTTYVVNRSGRIVGDPIVGAITSKAQADALQAQIDKALAADMG